MNANETLKSDTPDVPEINISITVIAWLIIGGASLWHFFSVYNRIKDYGYDISAPQVAQLWTEYIAINMCAITVAFVASRIWKALNK